MSNWKHRSSDQLQSDAAQLIEKGDLKGAATIWQHIMQRHPGDAHALQTLGTLRGLLGAYDISAMLLAKAVKLAPGSYGAHYNLGLAYSKLGRADDAVAAFERAVEIAPQTANAYGELGRAREAKRDYRGAIAAYEQATALAPDSPWFTEVVHCKHQICEWDDLDKLQNLIAARLNNEGEPTLSLLALTTSDDPQLQRRNAEAFFSRHYASPAPEPLSQPTGHDRPRSSKRRMRVGYMSGDYGAHPTSYLIMDLIEHHDRSRFEVFGFSVGAPDKSAIRAQLKKKFDDFFDCSNLGPAEIATLARRKSIDILIDLSGYTDKSQIKAFGYRAAPVQAHFLGFPGTLACRWVDYLFVDPFVVPPRSEQHYTESLCYLPNTYQVSSQRPSGPTPTRASQGLPDDAFVFCSFNNQAKIQPTAFEVWLGILKRVPGSVLWLYTRNDLALENCRAFAAAQGISEDRIVAAGKVPNEEHIARQSLADLMLDTFPYTGHTTTSDALWAGLPVVTCVGRSFASRVSGSLLRAHGMDDLITSSFSEFADLAVKIAKTPGMAGDLKRRALENRNSHPLFDTKRFCRDFETALLTMWERSERGEKPASFVVPPSMPSNAT